MAWNESGNGQKRPGQGGNQGPNDLDKIVQEWQKRLSALFGGGGGRRGGAAPGGGGIGSMALLLLAIAAWGLTGFYRVDQAERGLVLRFGDYREMKDPGLRWHLPFPIESVELVDVAEVNTFEKKTQILTADEAFVVVGMAVQFRRADPAEYRFNVRDPEDTLNEVSESAIREVVGKTRLDNILLVDQAVIALNTQELIQETLDAYEAGMEIVSVNLQEVEFPAPVRDAVQDAVKAREDQRTLILEAQTYSNDIVPKARGQAKRQVEDAEAYRERVIADAQGQSARFEALLAEYQEAPEVTRDRLYIETLEEVLRNSNKIVLDTGGSSNITVLPLQDLLGQSQRPGVASPLSRATSGSSSTTATRSNSETPTDDPRARRTR